MHTTLGAHPPRRLLAWVIALRCALALSAQTTVTYTPTFTATGVNMWGNLEQHLHLWRFVERKRIERRHRFLVAGRLGRAGLRIHQRRRRD
jgi:hypothetical protein